MIDNYEILPNGVIKQINHEKFIYDYQYIENYIKNRVISDDINFLRYGYICGVIGGKPNSILDIGYGDGGFLKICKKTINNCYGSDISNYPLPEGIIFLSFEDIFNMDFEIITFFDCLEHFEDLSFVSKLNCKYIAISVPNCHYFSDEWFISWKHRKPNEHLFHFNDTSLPKFMTEMGFKTLNISNIEDIIRINNKPHSNILTGIFQKI